MNTILMAPAGAGKSTLVKANPTDLVDGDIVIRDVLGWPGQDGWWKEPWASAVHASNYLLLAGKPEKRTILFVGAVREEWLEAIPCAIIVAPCTPELVWERARKHEGRVYPTSLQEAKDATEALLALEGLPNVHLLPVEVADAIFGLKEGGK